jgi:hypothetical protein
VSAGQLNIRGRAVGNRVLVDFGGVFGVDWHWRKVDEFCDALRRLAEHARRYLPAGDGAILAAATPADDLVIALSDRITMRTCGPRILVLLDARQGFECGAFEASQIWEQFKRAARRAEERDAVEQVIYDQAILTRMGARFGLTDDAAIQDEAGKEAAWNRELRRALPGGVRSTEAVGTPTIIRDPPPTKH